MQEVGSVPHAAAEAAVTVQQQSLGRLLIFCLDWLRLSGFESWNYCTKATHQKSFKVCSLYSVALYLTAKLHFNHLKPNVGNHENIKLSGTIVQKGRCLQILFTNVQILTQHPSTRKLQLSTFVGGCKHRAISEDK